MGKSVVITIILVVSFMFIYNITLMKIHGHSIDANSVEAFNENHSTNVEFLGWEWFSNSVLLKNLGPTRLRNVRVICDDRIHEPAEYQFSTGLVDVGVGREMPFKWLDLHDLGLKDKDIPKDILNEPYSCKIVAAWD